MVNYPEVLQLLLTALFVPLGYRGLRALNPAVGRWIAAALIVLLLSYVTTILEGYAWADFFNGVEHIGYAVTGICFALGARAGAARSSVRGGRH